MVGPANRQRTTSRVGPNAIIQLAEALRSRQSEAVTAEIFRSAGLSDYLTSPPLDLVDESEPARLFSATRHSLGLDEADYTLEDAGNRTGAYILAHRIPARIQGFLRLLPSPVAGRILMLAIAKHAWTFAGSGKVTCRVGRQIGISIEGNRLATPGCPWHRAVFTTLFRCITGKAVSVRHTSCCGRGADACKFEIALGGPLRSPERQGISAAGSAFR